MADRVEEGVGKEQEEEVKCNTVIASTKKGDAALGCGCNPEWDCAVCCELLYKPVVPPCGHPFCFWCAHRSMSYTSVSKCPLCRSEFTHLPRVSTLLHTLLSKSYPKKYEERAKETIEFEMEEEVQSMPATSSSPDQVDKDVAEVEMNSNSEEVEWVKVTHRSREGDRARDQKRDKKQKVEDLDEDDKNRFFDFQRAPTYSSATTAAHLFQPSIISPCSHCLCGLCSGMYVREDQDGDGNGPIKCCPVKTCNSRLVAPPSTCHVLHHFLVQKFGHLDRKLKVRRVREPHKWTLGSPDRSQPATTNNNTGAENGNESNAQNNIANATDNDNSDDAMQVDNNASDPHTQERIIRALKAPCETSSPESFVHFGVGCDGCGVCPIVGPRYTCMECEEKIGFDLCAHCHLNHSGPGRFNQQHKPEHRMKLVEGKETLLHSLLKDHPGFSAEYLMDLLNGMHP
jgi:hypothetical protein